MDIGIWMNRETLSHKLEAQQEENTEEAWNLNRWPQDLSATDDNRLFVACDGYWQGYFKLSRDALYNPEDTKTPYTLLFDTRTWTPIPNQPVKRFRGFTYRAPELPPEDASPTS